MSTYEWLRQATAKIRFSPDREAVRRELAGHLEERVEAEKARGLPQREAEAAAAAAMGDPDVLAEELGRIHSPWWGYLWRASRAALALLALCTVWAAGHDLLDCVNGWSRPELPGRESVYADDYGIEKSVLDRWRPRGAKKLGGYRFTVPMAWVEQWEAAYEDEEGTEVREDFCGLTVCLRADTWRFWEPCSPSQYMILDNTAADSQGNRYVYDSRRTDCRSFFCRTWSQPFTTWYMVYLYLPGPEEPPEWVDIPVGCGGDAIRVDLRGEVVW